MSLFAACSGANMASKSGSSVVYPSFTTTLTEWSAHTNFPASDSTSAVNGAKKSALLLLNEQMLNELDRFRTQSVTAGSSSLDSELLKNTLADFRVKENQVSNWDISISKKDSVLTSFVSATMRTQDIMSLLKNSKPLKVLVTDKGFESALIPLAQ